MNIFKSFCFSLAKKGAGADPKKSAPVPAQILNRLRLQPKNLGSDRLRFRNTDSSEFSYKLLFLSLAVFFLLASKIVFKSPSTQQT